MITVRAIVAVLSFAAFALVSGSATAQDYPSRAVTIIIPLAAGSGPDVATRILAERLEDELGQPFVIENRPGSAQVVGMNAVKSAAPDGYTIGMSTSGSFVIRPMLFKNPPYDPLSEFVPIANHLKSPFVLVVNPDLPVSTVPDLIEYVRQRPADVTFASSSIGGAPHLAMELMIDIFDLDMIHVPYRNSPQAFLDVAAGHVPMAFADVGTSLPLINDGRLKALAVSSLTPLDSLPSLAPFAVASGASDCEAVSWHLFFARSEVPREIIDVLHDALSDIMNEPDVRSRITELGLLPQSVPAISETRRYLRSETDKWRPIVTELGLAGSM